MNKVLSIIIPAYNCQSYLKKCVESMLCSEVIDYLDIIIVNDGSQDQTEAIAEKYRNEHPDSIRVISQENKGHGGALNTGCAAAKGKYLKVIDADDWVETSNLARYIKILDNAKSDVILTHHYTRDITTGEIKKWKTYPPKYEVEYSLEEIMTQWKNFDRSLTFHGITYRTDFYKKYSIQLSEHVFYEDHEYATIPCCYASAIMPVDLFIYNYRIGDVSQSVSDGNQLKRITHTEKVLKRLIKEYQLLDLPALSGGRMYYCMKAQGLLLSYITTAMLVNKNKKEGRKMGRRVMRIFQSKMPDTYQLAKKQYGIFLLMNYLHFNKRGWEKILRSKVYNKLRGNYDFQ